MNTISSNLLCFSPVNLILNDSNWTEKLVQKLFKYFDLLIFIFYKANLMTNWIPVYSASNKYKYKSCLRTIFDKNLKSILTDLSFQMYKILEDRKNVLDRSNSFFTTDTVYCEENYKGDCIFRETWPDLRFNSWKKLVTFSKYLLQFTLAIFQN